MCMLHILSVIPSSVSHTGVGGVRRLLLCGVPEPLYDWSEMFMWAWPVVRTSDSSGWVVGQQQGSDRRASGGHLEGSMKCPGVYLG